MNVNRLPLTYMDSSSSNNTSPRSKHPRAGQLVSRNSDESTLHHVPSTVQDCQFILRVGGRKVGNTACNGCDGDAAEKGTPAEGFFVSCVAGQWHERCRRYSRNQVTNRHSRTPSHTQATRVHQQTRATSTRIHPRFRTACRPPDTGRTSWFLRTSWMLPRYTVPSTYHVYCRRPSGSRRSTRSLRQARSSQRWRASWPCIPSSIPRGRRGDRCA